MTFSKLSIKKSDSLFILFIILLCVVLVYLPTGFENPSLTNSTIRCKAEVLKTDNSDLKSFSVVTVGTQDLVLLILNGKLKGDTIDATNVLMGQMKIDKLFKKGDRVMAVIKTNTDRTKILTARADDFYRINIEIILFILFGLFIIGFAGLTGFKALLSFVFTALSFWKILIPLYLKGFSPLFVALGVVSVTTGVIIILVSGFSRKGAVALAGAVSGIVITTVLAKTFGYFFQVPGTVQEYSETLLYTGLFHLNLSEIFIASIFISAGGAVMDVAMDIAASQNEISLKKPEIKSGELIRSGFHISYPVIGTMTTTLLFAYSGSFMFVFMVFMAKGTPMALIFNQNFIAAEILHTLVGSFGLVLVAPITSVIGGWYFTRKK